MFVIKNIYRYRYHTGTGTLENTYHCLMRKYCIFLFFKQLVWLCSGDI
jgi:hypothetical protein